MSIYAPPPIPSIDGKNSSPLSLPVQILGLSENFAFFGTNLSTGRTWLPYERGIQFSRHPHAPSADWIWATFLSSDDYLAAPLIEGWST